MGSSSATSFRASRARRRACTLDVLGVASQVLRLLGVPVEVVEFELGVVVVSLGGLDLPGPEVPHEFVAVRANHPDRNVATEPRRFGEYGAAWFVLLAGSRKQRPQGLAV